MMLEIQQIQDWHKCVHKDLWLHNGEQRQSESVLQRVQLSLEKRSLWKETSKELFEMMVTICKSFQNA